MAKPLRYHSAAAVACITNDGVVGNGINRCWTMTKRGRDSIARDASSFIIRPSSLHRYHDHLKIDICDIDMPLL